MLVYDIQVAAARYFDIPIALLTKAPRYLPHHVVRAREVAVYLAREMLGRSWPELGRCFGRHHSSIITTHQTTKTRLPLDHELRGQIEALRAELDAWAARQPGMP